MKLKTWFKEYWGEIVMAFGFSSGVYFFIKALQV
jgi:hypothetical protein